MSSTYCGTVTVRDHERFRYLRGKDTHTHLALTMLPAFSSTISSNPMAKISMGLALLSVKGKITIVNTKRVKGHFQGG